MSMQSRGYYYLICEIFLLTHFDLKHRARKGGCNFQYRQDALAFLETEWFEILCVSIDLDPVRVRNSLIRTSNYKRIKSS